LWDCYLLLRGFLEPLLNTPDYLLDISENTSRLIGGLIGAVLMFAAGLSGMLGLSPTSTLMILLGLPLALNEMVLAVWLIVKGFNSSAIDTELAQL